MIQQNFDGKSIVMEYDVLVAGGGLAGCFAAWAAARRGAKVVLVERYGCLGGNATVGGVSPMMAYETGGERLVTGLFDDFLARLTEFCGAPATRAFDPEAMKLVLAEMLLEAGVALRLHSWICRSEVNRGQINLVGALSKGGIEDYHAQIYVDATGDADLAALSGVPFEVGRLEDGLTQAMTLMFRIANVDTESVLAYCNRCPEHFRFIEAGPILSIAGFSDLIEQARKQGYDVPQDYIFFTGTPNPGELAVNTTRILDPRPLSAEGLTLAQVNGQRQAYQILKLLKAQVPGFENAYLSYTAPQVGVRDSRRILGEYLVSAEDILGARKFEDAIARGCYPIDIHSPKDASGVYRRLQPGESYDVPYRSLLPLKVDNLLVAGRCLSATFEAQAALRIMPTVAALGEAAGTAAALCAREGSSPKKLDPEQLRGALREQGANLG